MVDIACKVSGTTGLDNPSCNRWNCEISNDPDDHKNDIHRVGSIRNEGWIGQHLNVPFQNQWLYSCQHRTEQIRYWKPEINTDVPRNPLRKCGLKTVPH